MNEKTSITFEQELAQIQFDLLFFITQLLGRPSADAQDILQEVNRQICERRAEYDSTRAPLLHWARTLAYYEVLRWRKTQSRSRIVFSDETLERLSDVLATAPVAPLDSRLRYLDTCYHALPEPMRNLIAEHHYRNRSLDEMAATTGRPAHAIATALYKIRAALRKCIESKLRAEGAYA